MSTVVEEPRRMAPPGADYKRLIKIGVSVGILAILARKTDWQQVAAAIGVLRWPYAVASFAVVIVAQLISAVRWQWLARPLGFGRPLRHYISAYFVGMFFNLLLPSSVGGDAVRAVYLNANSKRLGSAALTVLLDRLSGLLVLLCVACVAAVVCPVSLPLWVQLTVGGAVLAAVLGLTLTPWLAKAASALANGTGHVARLGRLAVRLRDALSVYGCRPRLIVSSTALSAVVQVSSVLQVGLLGLAVGLDIPWSVYGVAAPMVSLLTLLPVSFNGMGLREAGMVLFLSPVDVPAGTAVTVAFLWFLVQSAAGLIGGAVYAFGAKLSAETPHDDALSPDPDQGRAGQRRSAA
jgi:uncharacterized protein (TIRG00374 family)